MLVVHDVAHAVVPHMYGSQGMVLAGALHVPVPLQVLGGVYVATEHDWPTQIVPAEYNRQAPAPSHMPSFPQVEVASCAHSLSGSVPAAIGKQEPFAPPVLVFEQAEQRPEHADSQQTPSTQKALAH